MIKTIFMTLIVFSMATIIVFADEKTVKIEATESDSLSITESSDADSNRIADTVQLDTTVTGFIAYYFHQTRRCPSCRKIEVYTDKAITTGFTDELKSGKLKWLPVNVDIEGNEHYMDDYELFTKSVIISRVENGREVDWKNLKKVWQLLNSEDKFIDYIVTEITQFMEKE